MFGDFLLIEGPQAEPKTAARLSMGDTGGRNEAWLRDTLFSHPGILPIGDLEPSFGPLIPLCTELRTEAGPLDIAYINPDGRLTLVECKLWRNAEARRKVVAQVLDYARAISRWSYADLQRQVSMATGRKGNVPYELARAVDPGLIEQRFVDAVTRSMRSGRFLLLIAGDGIREDIGGMSDLINRNTASAFSLGLVEVALYDLGDNGLAIQPRVLARTQLLERNVVIVRDEAAGRLEDEAPLAAPATPSAADRGGPEPGVDNPKQALYREWWGPVIASAFDDPDQEPAALRWPNNIRTPLPWPGAWLTAYRASDSGERLGVFLGGRDDDLRTFWEAATPELADMLAELPDGTTAGEEKGRFVLRTLRRGDDFPDEAAKRAWFASTLNAYVNALRPRMKRLLRQLEPAGL